MERVIAYVDGYNLYYGLRQKGWKRFYWLNIKAMVGHLLRPDQKLVATKYFTTIVNYPEAKHRRQSSFLEAVQRLFTDKRVVVACPPARSSKALKQAADAQIYVSRTTLAKSLFPDQVVKPDGYILRCPQKWR